MCQNAFENIESFKVWSVYVVGGVGGWGSYGSPCTFHIHFVPKSSNFLKTKFLECLRQSRINLSPRHLRVLQIQFQKLSTSGWHAVRLSAQDLISYASNIFPLTTLRQLFSIQTNIKSRWRKRSINLLRWRHVKLDHTQHAHVSEANFYPRICIQLLNTMFINLQTR